MKFKKNKSDNATLNQSEADEDEESLRSLGAEPETTKRKLLPWENIVHVDHRRPCFHQSKAVTNIKVQDFQVSLRIIEARQLSGLNMDPLVCVQVGDQKHYTSAREGTNCPYWNEFFAFDFNLAPLVLFDKIITLSVLHSRKFLRQGTVVGSFKLDVKTVYENRDHQFFHKWAVLTDPDDITGVTKGYLKCDISVLSKGDPVKPPPKVNDDDDVNIEANLLLPKGVSSERQRAKFIVRIFRADGLPCMNTSVMANLKSALKGSPKELLDSYIQVSFAGMTGRTSVKKNSYSPVWNEQIVFTEMFPPLCKRMKIQLRDSDTVTDNVIATHFLDLGDVCNDGEYGFLPTFGPTFIHLYGTTRDYSIIDDNWNLNEGLGEGVSYRGRLLIAIKTEISDMINTAPSKVEVEPAQQINEISYGKKEEFLLFGTVIEATIIDKRFLEKSISFEMTIGNFGNNLNGSPRSFDPSPQTGGGDGEALESVVVDSFPSTWHSTTEPVRAETYDREYCFLPYGGEKPCMYVRCAMPDHRRRMYHCNAIEGIAERLEKGLQNAYPLLDRVAYRCDVVLRETFESLCDGCKKYVDLCNNAASGLITTGKTRLDKERTKLSVREVEHIQQTAKKLAKNDKRSAKDKYRRGVLLLEKIKDLVLDPQDSLPDVFVWMLCANKRIAYHRISSRSLIYSNINIERGKDCGKIQTLFLRMPGNKPSSSFLIQAKIEMYFWLGRLSDKGKFAFGFPPGYNTTNELSHVGDVNTPPPLSVVYPTKHVFQLRAHMYQARSLVGSDATGLSDPFARVICVEESASTQVIEETVSPTWNELLILDHVVTYGQLDHVRCNPPVVVIEIWDSDRVGKPEFLGRAKAVPHVFLKGEPYETPLLEWFQLYRGHEERGELLATFELFQITEDFGAELLPALPRPKDEIVAETGLGVIFPIPDSICPKLVKYRFDFIFWGLRELKRVQMLKVEKPRVDIECAGHVLKSSIIPDATKNSNFATVFKEMEIELPEQEIYCPPLTIKVIDCRSFGRFTLVGTHVIKSIHTFLVGTREPVQKKKKRMFESPFSKFKSHGVKSGYLRQQSAPNFHEDSNLAGETGVSDTESSPLLKKSKEKHITFNYGSYKIRTFDEKHDSRKSLTDDGEGGAVNQYEDDDNETMDWWTKYFASRHSKIQIMPIVDARDIFNEPLIEYYNDIKHNVAHISPSTMQKWSEKLSHSTLNLTDISDLDNVQQISKELSKSTTSLPGFGFFKKRKAASKTNLLQGSTESLGISTLYGSKQDLATEEQQTRKGPTFKKVAKATKVAASVNAAKKRPKIALLQVYDKELESQEEFECFTEWLQTFELYRGKEKDSDFEDDGRVIGKFKGSIRVQKIDPSADHEPSTAPLFGFQYAIPSNEPISVQVKVYILKAEDLHPADLNGKADPYLVLQLGNKKISDKDNYISKQLNPIFGKCFEFEATFPQDSMLTIQVLDWDLLGSDDLIGQTKIDIENRFYSRHRATCGLSSRYDTQGYNKWRDPQKPSQLLARLCKESKVEGPVFKKDKVKIGNRTFSLQNDFSENPKLIEEHLSLAVLHHWHDVPDLGTHLVPEHIETRTLFKPEKPGIEQGRLEMWIDMFPMDMPLPAASVEVSPRKPISYELRVIIWNTDEVVLEDANVISGEKMSDIYVKGWLTGPEDQQATDVHYRSLTGEGNFNWRFLFPFEYLAAEEKIIIVKKESVMSWDESEVRIPPRLELQVWDADLISKDDFLGAITLDLNRFPRGAKDVKSCDLDLLKTDGSVLMMNLFKHKRTKGWWPFYIKNENTDELELRGKVEAELQLLSMDDAEKNPAGLGRNDPNGLQKPNRPDTSFVWFLNPLKSLKYILWDNFKWKILKFMLFLLVVLFFALFFYSLPGYTIKRMLGA